MIQYLIPYFGALDQVDVIPDTSSNSQGHKNSCYLLRRKLPMAWGTTKDRVTTEINHFPYARETKYLTLKDLETYLIPGF